MKSAKTVDLPVNVNYSRSGLSEHEVRAARQRFGENRLPAEKPTSILEIFINQVKSPLIYVIFIAAAVSLVMGEYGDFILIMVVVVVNVIMGFVQEYKAQRTYTALKSLLKPVTTVVRNGKRVEVEVWQIVPGDIVALRSGEKAPGDGMLVESTKISVDEAILTGESEPVSKHVGNTDQSVIYAGTTVLTGRGLMRVTSTGISTKLGEIAESLSQQKSEDTPLQVRLKAFSRLLTYIVIGLTLAILIVGLLLGYEFFEMLRTSIILAIAAIPEGILIAVTVILALGMRKILKRNGLVKRLLAVETLGSVSVICTDKTGTLTEGRMQLTKASLANQKLAWQTMVLCNDLEGPVDIALWEYAEKKIPKEAKDEFGSPQELADSVRRLDEELFTSETKFMITSVIGKLPGDKRRYFLKGAPEIVLGMCDVDKKHSKQILLQIDEWADLGLRLLGLAFREDGAAINCHKGYTWLGLVAMEDPVREGVVDAIKQAQLAGIKVKMITGDYRRTAEHIARNIGLMQDGQQTMEGTEIAALSDDQLRLRIENVAVFSRIHPQDKLRVVRALQSNNEITAMIGDGVNDAPALKRANIGVVVNNATDLAKETADLILLDSNFATIVAAIEEGRVIFTNVRKVVAYTLSNSFAAVLTIFCAMMLGWPAPLAVAQILWINLICDGPSDIVLGFEPKEKGVMREKPRALTASVLPHLSLILIAMISGVSAIFALLLFGYFNAQGDPARGQSIVFASFAINSMIYIFAYRSMRRSIIKSGSPFVNKYLIWAVFLGILTALVAFWIPGLRQTLGLVPLSLSEWGIVFGISFVLLFVVEVGKFVANRLHSEG